jgi:hypothetical protein
MERWSLFWATESQRLPATQEAMMCWFDRSLCVMGSVGWEAARPMVYYHHGLTVVSVEKFLYSEMILVYPGKKSDLARVLLVYVLPEVTAEMVQQWVVAQVGVERPAYRFVQVAEQSCLFWWVGLENQDFALAVSVSVDLEQHVLRDVLLTEKDWLDHLLG